MNRDMPSKGKNPSANRHRAGEIRRRLKGLQHSLNTRKNLGMLLRFRIKIIMINLRHELKQLT